MRELFHAHKYLTPIVLAGAGIGWGMLLLVVYVVVEKYYKPALATIATKAKAIRCAWLGHDPDDLPLDN